MSARIRIIRVDGSDIEHTRRSTLAHLRYLGYTDLQHAIFWTKFEAGVPGMDDEIISVVDAARSLGSKEREE